MAQRNYDDWLDAFVQYASIGEAPLDVLWWVGVSTIAGALRRRVWIDQSTFKWYPNFYVVTVANPGIISKTTTANVGFGLLKQIDGINFGPDIMSWQALVQHMGTIGQSFEDSAGGHYDMSAVTCAIDEYGTFIDPYDRAQIDNLTALWDGKEGTLWKASKTQGHDRLINPWLNIFANTTPKWLETNFPESFLGSGFMSRHIFIFAEGKRQKIAYPSENTPPGWRRQGDLLVQDLEKIADIAGPFHMTRDAIEWGTKWYEDHWNRFEHASRERLGFPARKQTHLHKLAMVISAARGDFPHITRQHLIAADAALATVEPGIRRILGVIGNTNITRASREIVEAMELEGKAVSKRELYGKYFFRRLSMREFEEALNGAVGAGYVEEDPMKKYLTLKRKLET